MGKRFIDTDAHKVELRKLDLKTRFTLDWLWRNCDCAGVWKPDEDLFKFEAGFALNIQALLKACPWVKMLPNESVFMPEFVTVNYGELKPGYNPHKPVFRSLEANGIEPLTLQFQDLAKSCQRLEEEGKEEEYSSGKERARPMADRIAAFEAEAKSVNAQKRILSDAELVKFIAYWTQAGGNDRKFHAEKQQTFGIQGRLITWGGRVKESTSVKPEQTGARRNLETDWDKA